MSVFRDYVTSSAFNLSLSRRQIECISQIDQYGSAWVSLATFGALVGKGLCERIDDEKSDYGRVQLTEAGHAVIPLLKLAGLYVQYPTLPEPVQLPEVEVTVKRKDEVPL